MLEVTNRWAGEGPFLTRVVQTRGVGQTTVRTELPHYSYGPYFPLAQGCRARSRAAACSDLGDLTQARDLAGLVIHCEEHGSRLWGMRLEELQGFI